MIVHISVHHRGKVDVVPGCCWVQTEFVCGNFLPIFPRRSFLFYRLEGEKNVFALPIPFSYRSMATAYLKWFLFVALFFAILFPIVMIDLVHQQETTSFALLAAGFIAAPAFGLLVLRWLSFASDERKAALAEVPGLPQAIRDKLTKDAVLYPEDDFFTKGRQDPFK